MTGAEATRGPEPSRLLDLLDPDDRTQLLRSCDSVAFKFGEVIVREDQPAHAMFIIVSGRARVVQTSAGREETVLASIGPGDVLGETALLQGGARTATVRASGDVSALRLDEAAFRQLCSTHPNVQIWLEQCSRARLLHAFLRRSAAFARLPSPVIRDLVAALREENVPSGHLLIRENDPPGPMYLVEDGRFRVLRASETPGQPQHVLAYLRAGDVVGEVSLLRRAPRNATVEALDDAVVLALQPDDFTRLCDRWAEFRHAVEERLATYDFQQEARLPLDLAAESVSPGQPGAVVGVEDEDDGDSDGEGERSRLGALSRALRPKPRRRRFPFVRQVDETDCGVACLSMVCRTYGKRVSLARLRSLAHTATDGTTLRNLCRAGEELGLAARAIRVSARNVGALPLPAILHWEGNHWVVLVQLTRKTARIADPALGVRQIPREELFAKWTGYAGTFDVTPSFHEAAEHRTSARWLWQYVRPHLNLIGKSFGLSLVAALLAMVLPILTQVVIDRVVVGGARGALQLILVGMGATALFRTLAGLMQGYLVSFVAVRLDASILDFLARRLLALPLPYFQARRAADIQRRLDGAQQVRQLSVTSGVAAMLAVVQVGVAVLLMLVYSPSLTAWFLVVLPVYGGLMFFAARYLRRLYEDLEGSQARYRSEQLDAIKGIESVKASSAEHAFREGLLQRFLAMARQQFRADLAVLTYQSGVEATSFVTSLLFLYLGALHALAGDLTLGSFVAFLSLVALAVGPLRSLLWQWDDLQRARVLVARIADVLESEPEQGWERQRLVPVRSVSGETELRGVTFRYGGADAPAIIKNLSLKVPAGQTVAIVGRSGSGKTTLVKLLSGLYEPSEGSILYDGIDMRTLNYRDLRRSMGFVLQDVHLFTGSVLENITLGHEPNLERAMMAARAAHAHEFIERLAMGYETRIGETGVGLSGGQAQRLAIARAVYGNPSILIFDEATSALDAESERAILENMSSLFHGRTVFVIAHRLSTVRDADWTIVLEQGEIVEQGTHDDLIDRRGLYFYLVSRQVEM